MTWRSLANRIAAALGLLHPRLFTPAGRYPAGEPHTVWVLSPGEIPTTDIYIRSRLQHRPDIAVRYINTLHESPADDGNDDSGVFVIVVRYAPAAWRRYLKSRQSVLAGVALMLDDDMPAAFADPHLPLRYAAKTAWRYARGQRDLAEVCDSIWVSSAGLQQKYAETPTRLVPPLYLPRQQPLGEPGQTYFYHGSAAHRLEIEWLVDVVAEVQKRNPRAAFEIFGNERVRRLYRHIPRVTVLPPMPWRQYLAYTSSITRAVGLAPQLDTGFNASRSYNKIFDITRCGAVGLYSDTAAFREALGDNHCGELCANDPAIWIEKTLSLLNDEQLPRARHHDALRWTDEFGTESHFQFRKV
ncbi:MAG: hypothetical protein OEV08_10755 [Nitrospira sp.]|nr:hypothetical protein [Nitrospira sp.]